VSTNEKPIGSHAGARVAAFDLLFPEPDEPVPADLRDAARTAAAALNCDRSEGLRAVLERLADSDRDSRFAAAIRASGHVLHRRPEGADRRGDAAVDQLPGTARHLPELFFADLIFRRKIVACSRRHRA
jgi:hypothetical protein